MITVNGQSIPSPDRFCVEIFSIDKNTLSARGDILTDILGVKRRITLGYEFIDAQSLAFLFALVDGDVDLSCPDPQEGGQRGGKYLCSQRQTGAAAMVDGALWWRDASVVLTER